MTDRYRGYPPLTGRSAAFNPARVSLANSLSNYGPGPLSTYTAAAEADFVASPQRYTSIPRGYHPPTGSASGSPGPTSRTYPMSPMSPEARPPSRPGQGQGQGQGLGPGPGNREPSRNRRSTLDAVARPPIIVTSMQDHHPHSAAAHSSAAASIPSAHSPSPVRDAPYRASDGKLYAQPASTVRSRSANRPYHASSLSEDYGPAPTPTRARQPDLALALASRDADSYRSSRPSVHYPSDPRHSNAAIDYGDDGYQYTNAGELVKYDLDHPAAAPPPTSRSSRRHERHESFDRGYHRPNINYDADQRRLNVKTGHELGRHYSVSSRPYDTRGGPPPSTRGFDKINRGTIDTIPLSLPAPAAPASTGSLDGSVGTLVRRDSRRARPVSLTQEIGRGSSGAHPDDYYRGHIPDDAHDYPRYYDDAPSSHRGGFPIRTSPPNGGPDERQSRYREPKRDEAIDDLDWEHPTSSSSHREEPRREKSRQNLKSSDDDDLRGSDVDKEEWYRASYKDDARRTSEGGGSSEPRPGSSFRDKITAGFGMAASAVGLGSSSAKRDDRKTHPEDDKEKHSSRRQSLDDDAIEVSLDRDHEREPERGSPRDGDMARKSDADLRERHRREAQAKLEGEAVVSGSESDDGSHRAPSIAASVRRRASNVSIANSAHSASDPKQVREQAPDAAAKPAREQEEDDTVEPADEAPRGREPSRSPDRDHGRARSVSPAVTDPDLVDETPLEEENRGRDLVVASEFKQVRVVSPPREKKVEGKPLKGILKQPKPSFPEERNPIREGVAPHKDDKKLKEVPLGAKWTKINRKIVNPEALEIGKERYEVRDDFVIVLRVLSKEEIQTYASATQVLRERRRNKENNGERERERDRDRERDYDRSYDDYDEQPFDENRERERERERERPREPAPQTHHHRRQRADEGAPQEDWAEDRERDRRRRTRRDEEEYSSRPRNADPEHRHHRAHRERA